MLSCPICQSALQLAERSYQCHNRHHYDIAKDGYVNLHVVQHKNSKQAGDTPASVQARRRFLSQGFYQPLKDSIASMVQDLGVRHVVDIGCGEGYYTQALAGDDRQVIGIDIAKSAIATAAKAHKQANITWVVGTGAILPVMAGSAELITSFFSPLPKAQMLTTLQSKGYLLMATPAPRHLYALRQALFDEVKLHEPTKFIAQMAPEFKLIDERLVISDMCLTADQLSDLIQMTPYGYRAKLSNKQTLLAGADGFDVQAQFCVYLFERADGF